MHLLVALGVTFVVTSILRIFNPGGILQTLGSGMDYDFLSPLKTWSNPFARKSILRFADTFIALQADHVIPAIIPKATSVGRPYIIEMPKGFANLTTELLPANLSASNMISPEILNLSNTTNLHYHEHILIQRSDWTAILVLCITALVGVCMAVVVENRRLRTTLSHQTLLHRVLDKLSFIPTVDGLGTVTVLRNLKQEIQRQASTPNSDLSNLRADVIRGPFGRERTGSSLETGPYQLLTRDIDRHLDFVISIIDKAKSSGEGSDLAHAILHTMETERDNAVDDRDAVLKRERALQQEMNQANQCLKDSEERCIQLEYQLGSTRTERDNALSDRRDAQDKVDSATQGLETSKRRCEQLDSRVSGMQARIQELKGGAETTRLKHNQDLEASKRLHEQNLADAEKRIRSQKDAEMSTMCASIEEKDTQCTELKAQNSGLEEALRRTNARMASPSSTTQTLPPTVPTPVDPSTGAFNADSITPAPATPTSSGQAPAGKVSPATPETNSKEAPLVSQTPLSAPTQRECLGPEAHQYNNAERPEQPVVSADGADADSTQAQGITTPAPPTNASPIERDSAPEVKLTRLQKKNLRRTIHRNKMRSLAEAETAGTQTDRASSLSFDGPAEGSNASNSECLGNAGPDGHDASSVDGDAADLLAFSTPAPSVPFSATPMELTPSDTSASGKADKPQPSADQLKLIREHIQAAKERNPGKAKSSEKSTRSVGTVPDPVASVVGNAPPSVGPAPPSAGSVVPSAGNNGPSTAPSALPAGHNTLPTGSTASSRRLSAPVSGCPSTPVDTLPQAQQKPVTPKEALPSSASQQPRSSVSEGAPGTPAPAQGMPKPQQKPVVNLPSSDPRNGQQKPSTPSEPVGSSAHQQQPRAPRSEDASAAPISTREPQTPTTKPNQDVGRIPPKGLHGSGSQTPPTASTNGLSAMRPPKQGEPTPQTVGSFQRPRAGASHGVPPSATAPPSKPDQPTSSPPKGALERPADFHPGAAAPASYSSQPLPSALEHDKAPPKPAPSQLSTRDNSDEGNLCGHNAEASDGNGASSTTSGTPSTSSASGQSSTMPKASHISQQRPANVHPGAAAATSYSSQPPSFASKPEEAPSKPFQQPLLPRDKRGGKQGGGRGGPSPYYNPRGRGGAQFSAPSRDGWHHNQNSYDSRRGGKDTGRGASARPANIERYEEEQERAEKEKAEQKKAAVAKFNADWAAEEALAKKEGRKPKVPGVPDNWF
ncbi:MAG: hypothetical protein Q9181_005007 [Wetmoreana brouardii]